MALEKYKEKRDFKKTSEPGAVKKSSKGSLAFVVQKHAASRLHYDFRLELDGVLKSWAVPKGPSINPSDKRLAMMVEDHPYDYKDFEGSIPKGEYGAGEVIVWDRGTIHAIGTTDKAESERIFREGLKKGDLKFVLNGEKLKGEFVLVNMKSRGENHWLLIKHKDEYAGKEDITKKDRSVISGNTIEDMARGDVKKKSGPAIS
jgi:bifunctional non-homologous end joining protein LigD